jgi:DNA-binding SARP family transcriptional activator
MAGLYVYVSQLRKFLDSVSQGENPVITHSSGYFLQADSDKIDFHNFRKLVNMGRDHVREQDYECAVSIFESALSLWRGPMSTVLGNGSIGYGFATWINELRMECTEMLMDCHVRLGHHREFVGQLYALTAEHPLREAFYCQLMLALYRSDRQADALAVYQQARQTLLRELGLEPCRALQSLQRAILSADAELNIDMAV